jgi:hypothetical protein
MVFPEFICLFAPLSTVLNYIVYISCNQLVLKWNLKKQVGLKWIHLAHDKVNWEALTKILLKVRVI